AISGVAMAAVPPAAAAPPTTAPLRKSRRSSFCSVMVPSLPRECEPGGRVSMLFLSRSGKTGFGDRDHRRMLMVCAPQPTASAQRQAGRRFELGDGLRRID